MCATPSRALILASALLIAPALFAADKVGLLLKARGDGQNFWGAMEKGAVDAAQKGNAELVVKAAPNETDIAVQIRLLNALVEQGAQAIVIAPASREALALPVSAAAKRGIHVVVVDTPLPGNSTKCFVGTDHEAAGKAAGELVASLIGDTDEISLFKHSQSSGATLQRDAGALATLRAARPKAVIHGDIYASSETGVEHDRAQLVLQTHPNIKAVLATGTPGTLAMMKVLQEKNLAGKIKLVGFGFNLRPDVAAAIESGALSGWIAQLPGNIGEKGVNAALSLIKGETVPAVLYTDFVVITKDNLKDPKVQALLSM